MADVRSLSKNGCAPISHSTSIVSSFDWIAPDYDRMFTNSHTGIAQRESVWRFTDRLFKPGQRILELNCGTGVDALHFTRHGLMVSACDQSVKMIEIARHRLRQSRCEQAVQCFQLSIEKLSEWRAPYLYDAVFSNFGGLNCVTDLRKFCGNLVPILKPGGTVVLCLMNRYCLWEWGYFLGQFRFRKAFRRLRKGGAEITFGNHTTMQVHYPGVRQWIEWMSPHFRYSSHRSIGLAVPPPYAEEWTGQHLTFLHVAKCLDGVVCSWPGFRSLGDHYLMHFVRR
ncbi:MAG: methyltransferase domain-containing protein [Terriglobia bacterium]